MALRQELGAARARWNLLGFYQKFEYLVVVILTALIALIIALAVWNLTVTVIESLIAANFDPTDYAVFQTLFGMIFTVIIALEFKKSLLVVAERHDSIIQIRSVIVIALLAICRKIIILDLTEADAWHILAFAAAIVALGVVYWLIRDSDQPLGDARRDQPIGSSFDVNL